MSEHEASEEVPAGAGTGAAADAAEDEGGGSPLVVVLLLAIVGAVIYTFVSTAPSGSSEGELPPGSDVAQLLAQGRALGEQGRMQEALPYALKAAQLAPEDAKANAAVGDVLASLQRHDEALAYLQKAYELRPDFQPYAVLLGRSLTALEHHQEARPPLQRALELSPVDPEPHYCLGFGAMRTEDWQGTVRHLEAFVARAPEVPASRRYLPLALRLLSDAQDAIGQGEASLAALSSLAALVPPQELGVRFALARKRLEVQGLDAALRAHDASGEDATFEDLCVEGHLRAFDPRPAAHARAPLERAHALAPDRPEPLLGLALEDARGGDLPAAQERLEELLQQAPQHGGAKLLLAQVHRLAGRPAEALAIYEGLRGTPQGPLAEREILATHLAAEDAEAALTFVQGLFPDAAPGDPRHFLEAEALQQLGRFDQARAVLERLRDQGREEDRTLWTFYLGRLALDQGEAEAARAAFDSLDLPLRGEDARRFPRVNLWAGVAFHPVDPERAQALWRATAEDGVRWGERALPTLACARLLGEASAEELAGAARIAEWQLHNDALVIEALARAAAGDAAGARDAYADAVAASAGKEFPARLALRALE